MSDNRFRVENRPDEGRYVLLDLGEDGTGSTVAGEESYVDVTAADGSVQRVLFHTGVDEAYGGQGLAGRLVGEVVADVVAAGLKIVPVCPYVAKWLPKHPEYDEHVVAPSPTHLQAVQQRR